MNMIRKIMVAMDQERREHKKTFIVYMILRVLVIICMIRQIFNHNYENVLLCILTMFLFVVPTFLEVNLRIRFPDTMEVIILMFIYSAEILGEIEAYYLTIPNWDTVLHTLNGFLMAAIGFSLVDLLNRNERLTFKLSAEFMSLVAFCFSMTVGVLWEFFEYVMDLFFGFDMQKDTVVHSIYSVMLNAQGKNTPVAIRGITDVVVNGQSLGLGGYLDIGLHDTMNDLMVNFIGAVVFSVIGYFYVKQKGKNKMAEQFIPRLKEDVDQE